MIFGIPLTRQESRMWFCSSRPPADCRLAATIVFIVTFADLRFFEARRANIGTATRTSAVRQIGRPVLAFFHVIEIGLERLELLLWRMDFLHLLWFDVRARIHFRRYAWKPIASSLSWHSLKRLSDNSPTNSSLV